MSTFFFILFLSIKKKSFTEEKKMDRYFKKKTNKKIN